MWSKRNQERHLWALRSEIDCAPEPTKALVADVLYYACPRLQASLTPNDLVVRLIEAEAWIELGLWLIGWELPDMDVHQLTRGDHAWNCSICVRGLASNWLGDVADFQHESLALAILGALVEAQLRKVEGQAPSNVTAFRRRDAGCSAACPSRGLVRWPARSCSRWAVMPVTAQTEPVPAEAPAQTQPLPARSSAFWTLTLGTLGVVYGDIGTSPLYALKESLSAAARRRRPHARDDASASCRSSSGR